MLLHFQGRLSRGSITRRSLCISFLGAIWTAGIFGSVAFSESLCVVEEVRTALRLPRQVLPLLNFCNDFLACLIDAAEGADTIAD